MDIVVSGGGHPEKPLEPGRPPRDRTQVLLTLLVVGVFLGAAFSAFTAWTAYSQREDNRALQCAYLDSMGGSGAREFADLDDIEKKIVETFDCDVEGR